VKTKAGCFRKKRRDDLYVRDTTPAIHAEQLKKGKFIGNNCYEVRGWPKKIDKNRAYFTARKARGRETEEKKKRIRIVSLFFDSLENVRA